MMNRQQVLNKLRDAKPVLVERYGVTRLALFGSPRPELRIFRPSQLRVYLRRFDFHPVQQGVEANRCEMDDVNIEWWQ